MAYKKMDMNRIEAFVNWYKRLQLSQKTGFAIAAICLFILPVALFASQNKVSNESQASDQYGQPISAKCGPGLPCKPSLTCVSGVCKPITIPAKCPIYRWYPNSFLKCTKYDSCKKLLPDKSKVPLKTYATEAECRKQVVIKIPSLIPSTKPFPTPTPTPTPIQQSILTGCQYRWWYSQSSPSCTRAESCATYYPTGTNSATVSVVPDTPPFEVIKSHESDSTFKIFNSYEECVDTLKITYPSGSTQVSP